MTRAELVETLNVERFTRYQRTNPDPPAERRYEALLMPPLDQPTLFDQPEDVPDDGTQRDRPVFAHQTVSSHPSLRNNERG